MDIAAAKLMRERTLDYIRATNKMLARYQETGLVPLDDVTDLGRRERELADLAAQVAR